MWIFLRFFHEWAPLQPLIRSLKAFKFFDFQFRRKVHITLSCCFLRRFDAGSPYCLYQQLQLLVSFMSESEFLHKDYYFKHLFPGIRNEVDTRCLMLQGVDFFFKSMISRNVKSNRESLHFLVGNHIWCLENLRKGISLHYPFTFVLP